MIRKLKTGEYRLYSRSINPKTGKRRNLGTFPTLEKAKEYEQPCSSLSGMPRAEPLRERRLSWTT